MPSLIFLVFGTTHVILDTYSGLYNQAFIQIWITLLVTLLLNALCQHQCPVSDSGQQHTFGAAQNGRPID